MVKIIFDLLDILSPTSRESYKTFIIKRFESFANSQLPHLQLEKELQVFSRKQSTKDYNDKQQQQQQQEEIDRFELIRDYASLGLQYPCGKYYYRQFENFDDDDNNDDGADNNEANKKKKLEIQDNELKGCKVTREYLYNLEETAEDLASLELTSDAPIVRCLLGLYELPDCSLWLLAKEPPIFVTIILRNLPVSPFFESLSKLWRIIDVFADSDDQIEDFNACKSIVAGGNNPQHDLSASINNSFNLSSMKNANGSVCVHSKGRKLATYSQIAARMGTLGHEAIVRVSECKATAIEAAKNEGWVGIFLMASQLNREASVEQFSPSKISYDSKHLPPPVFTEDEATASRRLSPATTTNALSSLTSTVVTSSPQSSTQQQQQQQQQQPNPPPSSAISAKIPRFAIAKGIASLGHTILVNVPELAANVTVENLSETASPLLFTLQSQKMKTKFCFCKCFWTGVGAGTIATVGAVATFSIIGLVIVTTIRSFAAAAKRKN